MRIFATPTSPYARRVRIVAHELGAPVTLVDTSTTEGQAALRALTPIWKIPVAETEDGVIFDSGSICAYLLERHGPRHLRVASSGPPRWREQNLVHAADGALDSAINLRFLKLEGADPSRLPYLGKQAARIESA